MKKILKCVAGVLLTLGLITGCTSNESKRGGTGGALYFTDFSEATRAAAFSPKGDGNWNVGRVTFSGYYPFQLAKRHGHENRNEQDSPTGVGQLRLVSKITVPAYIQTREQVSPGQNPNLLNVLSSYTVGDFTAETALVFYSGKASNYDDAADKERAVELRRRAGAGVVFRYQDPANYYIMRTGGENGIEIGKMVNNQYTSLKFVPTERLENFLTPERSVVLRVVAKGGQIDAYVDNNLIARVQDNTFPIGQVGLTTFRIKAGFLYFSLWEDFGPNLPYF